MLNVQAMGRSGRAAGPRSLVEVGDAGVPRQSCRVRGTREGWGLAGALPEPGIPTLPWFPALAAGCPVSASPPGESLRLRSSLILPSQPRQLTFRQERRKRCLMRLPLISSSFYSNKHPVDTLFSS